MSRLRVLIEIDSETVLELDLDVEQANISNQNDLFDAGTTPRGAVIRKPTGWSHLTLDYQRAAAVEKPA